MKFGDGQLVPQLNQVKYLGCLSNDKGDPNREIKKRIAECMVSSKKRDIFWRKSDNSTKFKLIARDATLRSKLLYGLESVQINNQMKKTHRCIPAKRPEENCRNVDHLCRKREHK